MLELKNISKRFGNKQIFDQFNLIVEEGKTLSLVGPSGGGKTTLLRMLAGLEKLDSGEIIYNGKSVSINHLEDANLLGFVFQDFQLFPHLSVLDNLILSPTKTLHISKKVLFSDIYMETEEVLIVKKDSSIAKLSDMADKVIGAQAASSGYEAFISNPEVLKDIVKDKDAVQYSTFTQAFIDLENDRIDALLVDKVYANYYLAQKNETQNYRMLSADLESGDFAVGARKADVTLITKINEGFKKLYKEGKFQEISKYPKNGLMKTLLPQLSKKKNKNYEDSIRSSFYTISNNSCILATCQSLG